MKIENMNRILDRESIEQSIIQHLSQFDEQNKNIAYKKGVYIYGSPGSGKTQFVVQLLEKMGYDVIRYDAGDVRNKSLIETITSNNVSSKNVLTMMTKKVKKIAIVMDEIDGMNNGDKGGITALIKLIRQKKTKKQRMESFTMNPIVCIGNYYMDKKIKELMKVCCVYELKRPDDLQIETILYEMLPSQLNSDLVHKMLDYVQGDLRKLDFIQKMYLKDPAALGENLDNIFHLKSFNEDAKKITQLLFQKPVSFQQHSKFMNETDRTTVALLWHENVVDAVQQLPPAIAYDFYVRVLDNICYADYIDRITFQNQIWQFNEMSSIIKTFHNTRMYHEVLNGQTPYSCPDVRFTKILTKYSTEYNNMLFVSNLCQELDLDKKDLVAFFQEMRLFYGREFMSSAEKMAEVDRIMEDYEIDRLDIKRMFRYLDKNVKSAEDDFDDDDDDTADP
jgi:Cdc6-like AAA superfamily ATPase